MIKNIKTLSLFASLTFSAFALAAATKEYQVTGPVLEISPTKIVVQKSTEKWELNRDATTKVPADLKVGDKVTVVYQMKASEVTKKLDAAAKKPKK